MAYTNNRYKNKYTPRNKDNKGNWEFSFYQKKLIPNEEQNIKKELCPENSFDPAKIHQYINPEKSKEEKIIEKKNSGNKLDKAEEIIVANYLKRKKDAIEEDIKEIERLGLNAKPTTGEGRTRLIFETLKYLLNKNNEIGACNISLKLKEPTIINNEEIKSKYNREINKMNAIVNKKDMIEMQFTQFHNQMPPLNMKGFHKFDPWQVNVIRNIDDNKSTIVSAPTSAGKTVLSGYATIKGNTLIVMPTDALVWQMASYVGGILNIDVPIVTQTFQSIPKRDELVEKLNKSRVFVGTAEAIVDFLPFITIKFDWIIFDEIHMIGKDEGSSMEIIAKIYNDVPFLALSATIGNIDEITSWFQKLNVERVVTNIVCDKRFFNLQKFYYNPIDNKLEMLHPLALCNINEIEDKSILKKNLQPTPPATWKLYQVMKEHFDLGDLNHQKYFEKDEQIHLSRATNYFSDLIKYLVDNFNKEKVEKILKTFKNMNIAEDNVNIRNQVDEEKKSIELVNMAFHLKENDKCPAIVFQKNTMACLRIVRQFAKTVDKMEKDKFPRLDTERARQNKKAERQLKIKEKDNSDITKNQVVNSRNQIVNEKMEKTKKEQKKMLEDNDEEDINIVPIEEPTPEFTFNNNQFFGLGIVEEWVATLKKYFPCVGTEYHFIIKLLWRGVGVYAKGLPDPYLLIVQKLANAKKLAIVFSDMSLVFGVSMPFRSVVVYRDNIVEDDLDPMLYHQMAGRAGRRGLDKEGNVIFAGYKWKRIEELSICPIPNIVGKDILNMVIPHAQKLSEMTKNNLNWELVFNNPLDGSNEEDNMEQLEMIKSNYDNGWKFAIDNDKNYLHMMWKLRNLGEEPIIISFLLSYIKRGFDGMNPDIINNQINIAHFLSHFLNIKETENDDLILSKFKMLDEPSFSNIFELLDDLQLTLPKKINKNVFISIQTNKIVDCQTEKEADELRNRLFNFGDKIKAIQHFFFHQKSLNLARLLGKLLTRIWWIYHGSSPIMKKFHEHDENHYELEDSSDDEDNENVEGKADNDKAVEDTEKAEEKIIVEGTITKE